MKLSKTSRLLTFSLSILLILDIFPVNILALDENINNENPETVEEVDKISEEISGADEYIIAGSENLTSEKVESDKTAAKTVEDKINAIGEVVYTPECEAKIKDAQKSYNALTNEQKALVTNLETLEKALGKFSELKTEHREQKAKASGLASRLIKVGEITLEDKTEIESIRADYNALKPVGQEYFQNFNGHNYLSDLEAAEAKLAELEKAVASIGTTLYSNLNDAITASKTGDTIVVLKSIDENLVILGNGINLDLNGFTLNINKFVAFNNDNVIDSSIGSKGKLISKNMVLSKNNSQLPVFDVDGYRFFDIDMKQLPLENVDTGFKYVFRPQTTKNSKNDLKKLLANGYESSNIKIGVIISWNETNQIGKQEFEFRDIFVKNTYGQNKAFLLTTKGVSSLEDVKVCSYIISDTGVEILSTEMPYVFNGLSN